MSNLEQRLEFLERRNSQLQAVMCLMIGLAILVWVYDASPRGALASQATPQDEIQKIVKTRLLQVVDESGKVVWEAGASEQGGDMTIFNQKQQPVYRAEANRDGCTVQLNSPDGAVRTLLASRPEDGGFSILNDKARPIVMMYGNQAAGNLVIQGEEGSDQIHASVQKEGSSRIELKSAKNAPAMIVSSQTGNGTLQVFAEDIEKPVLEAGTSRDKEKQPEPYLQLISPAGKNSVKMWSNKEGGNLETFSAAGDPNAGFLSTKNGSTLALFGAESRFMAYAHTHSGIQCTVDDKEYFSVESTRKYLTIKKFEEEQRGGRITLRNLDSSRIAWRATTLGANGGEMFMGGSRDTGPSERIKIVRNLKWNSGFKVTVHPEVGNSVFLSNPDETCSKWTPDKLRLEQKAFYLDDLGGKGKK